MSTPTIGDRVFFRLEDGPNAGEFRPALIVRSWPAQGMPVEIANLIVFLDGSNDATGSTSHTPWKTSRAEGPLKGQWLRHLPEPEEAPVSEPVRLVEEQRPVQAPSAVSTAQPTVPVQVRTSNEAHETRPVTRMTTP